MGNLKITESLEAMLGRGVVVLAFAMLAIPDSGCAHELPKTEETEALLLTESLSSGQTEEEPAQRTIIYHWIGGRFDRVTVEHPGGLREIYQNTDSRNNLWNADETELGQLQNVRQWRFGSW